MQVVTKNRLHNFFRAHSTNKLVALAVVLVVVIAGYMVIASRASSFFASVEPETGTLATNAQVITDSTASGGKAVQFNAPAPPPPPPAAGYPDATNTGVPAGTHLIDQYDTNYRITTPGTVIDGWNFFGQVEIFANNVTIKNSRVHCSTTECIYAQQGVTGVHLSHDEIGPDGGTTVSVDGQGVISWETGPAPASANVFDSLNIHNVSDGMFLSGGVTFTNNWVHDLDMTGDGAHSDDIQSQGCKPGSSVLIQHNTLEGGNTSNIIVQLNDYASGYTSCSNWVINDNQMLGRDAGSVGGRTSWSIGFDDAACPQGGCRYTNNRLNRIMDSPSYTPTTLWTSANWYGNVYIDNGAVVPVP